MLPSLLWCIPWAISPISPSPEFNWSSARMQKAMECEQLPQISESDTNPKATEGPEGSLATPLCPRTLPLELAWELVWHRCFTSCVQEQVVWHPGYQYKHTAGRPNLGLVSTGGMFITETQSIPTEITAKHPKWQMSLLTCAGRSLSLCQGSNPRFSFPEIDCIFYLMLSVSKKCCIAQLVLWRCV